MTEEQAMTRQEIEAKLVAQAWQDDSFKQQLISNPKSTFAKEGIPLPESIEIKVVEESANC
jgi:Nitrile hydratase, alpha chain